MEFKPGLKRAKEAVGRIAKNSGWLAVVYTRMMDGAGIFSKDNPENTLKLREYHEIRFGMLLAEGKDRAEANRILNAERGENPGLYLQQAMILSDYRDHMIGNNPESRDVLLHYMDTDPASVIADSIVWAIERDRAMMAILMPPAPTEEL